MRTLLLLLATYFGCSKEGKQPPSNSEGSPGECSGVTACEAACKTGDGAACRTAAHHYYDGIELPVDYDKSLPLVEQACDLNDAMGCVMLGYHYQDGLGMEWEPSKALPIYEKACSLGDGVGCFNISTMYSGGHGVDFDDSKAKEYFDRAIQVWKESCDSGQFMHGCVNYAGNMPEFDKNVVRSYNEKACQGENQFGCLQIARHDMLLDGLIDEAKFIERLNKLCDGGLGEACEELWTLGADERGQDKACKRGIAMSCVEQAASLRQSQPKKAESLLERGCDLRNGRACGEWASMLLAKEDPRGTDAIKRTCHIGDRDACEWLARYHLTVEHHDEKQASRYLRESCRMGSPNACMHLVVRGEPLPGLAFDKKEFLEVGCGAEIQNACGLLEAMK